MSGARSKQAVGCTLFVSRIIIISSTGSIHKEVPVKPRCPNEIFEKKSPAELFPFFEGVHTALPGRLAEEILTIGHPQLFGCFDVSHAYIACAAYGADLPNEAKKISPVSPHWHVHDSFGRPNTGLNPYIKSECLAYGMGDLHLAVGDGDLPWSSVLNSAPPISGSTFNIELNPDLWSDMPQCVTATRQLISDAARLKAA